MADYQLELRQIVDYPRCRIYREFIQTLITDRNIRTGGCSGLFYYVVLCAYANFRTSYRLRKSAVESLSSVLWGFSTKDTLDILGAFFPPII